MGSEGDGVIGVRSWGKGDEWPMGEEKGRRGPTVTSRGRKGRGCVCMLGRC